MTVVVQPSPAQPCPTLRMGICTVRCLRVLSVVGDHHVTVHPWTWRPTVPSTRVLKRSQAQKIVPPPARGHPQAPHQVPPAPAWHPNKTSSALHSCGCHEGWGVGRRPGRGVTRAAVRNTTGTARTRAPQTTPLLGHAAPRGRSSAGLPSASLAFATFMAGVHHGAASNGGGATP